MKPYRSIGIMSGTSGDGVDAVLLELDDVHTPHRGRILDRSHVPFSAALSDEIVHAQKLSLPRLTELHFLLPTYYAQAAQALSAWQTAACCGMHGQTITHQVAMPPPHPRGTLQIGASAALAAALGMPVVADLRSADVALGGQGAPIVPIAHWYFLAPHQGTTMVVNLGGICNMSWLTPHMHGVMGYDVGPGMMLSDAFAKRITHGALTCDLDGQLSAGGKVIAELLAYVMAHPFVARSAPKSAGREDFGATYYEPLFARFAPHHPDRDIMYTLIVATAHILRHTVTHHLSQTPPLRRVVLTGGGALNPLMQRSMQTVFADVPVQVENTGVLAPQNHEPAAMALIASRTMHRLPSGLPRVTGAAYGAVLGHICWPTPVAKQGRTPSNVSPSQTAVRTKLLHEELHAIAQRVLAQNDATAVSFCVHQHHETLAQIAHGDALRYAADPLSGAVNEVTSRAPVDATSLFDLASVTKVAATTAAIMALISDGRLALHAQVGVLLPALARTDKANITVGELLAHRSGLAPWRPVYMTGQGIGHAIACIAAEPLVALGPTERIYSDLGYMLLGAIIETVTQMPLDRYVHTRIFAPLQATSLTFCPDLAAQKRCVATAHSNAHEQRMIDELAFGPMFAGKAAMSSQRFSRWRQRTLQGDVNDGNAAYALNGVAGHAGLFGCAKALARVVDAMTGVTHTGVFAPDVVAAFCAQHDGNHYWGWNNPCRWPSLASMQPALSAHGAMLAEGFTGTLMVAMPNLGLSAVMLTNRQHQGPNASDTLPKLYAHYAAWIRALLAAVGAE